MRPDGKELFYITRGASASGALVAVAVTMNGDMISFGSGVALFPAPIVVGAVYDPVPDGTSFVFTDRRAAPDAPISVIFNWQQLLEGDHGQ